MARCAKTVLTLVWAVVVLLLGNPAQAGVGKFIKACIAKVVGKSKVDSASGAKAPKPLEDFPAQNLDDARRWLDATLQAQMQRALETGTAVTLHDAKGGRYALEIQSVDLAAGTFRAVPLTPSPQATLRGDPRTFQFRYFDPKKTRIGAAPPGWSELELGASIRLTNIHVGKVLEGRLLGFDSKAMAVVHVDGEPGPRKISPLAFRFERRADAVSAPRIGLTQPPIQLIGGAEGLIPNRKTPTGSLAASTDHNPGGKYTHNEDSLYVSEVNGATVIAVVDGMGAMGHGQEASQIVAHSCRRGFEAERPMAEIVADAYPRLKDAVDRGKIEEGSGATVVTARIQGDQIEFAHVGDSRGIVVRQGRPVVVTQDHSMVQAKIRKGEITEKQAMLNRDHKDLINAISVEVFQDMGEIATEVTQAKLERGDWVVMASDGLWDSLTSQEVAEILKTARTPEEARALLRNTISKPQRGRPAATDNVTIAVYRHGV